MRTQPRDLIQWTAAYFKALAEGVPPPVKEMLEYPQAESKDGVTVGYLRILNKQVSYWNDDKPTNLMMCQ